MKRYGGSIKSMLQDSFPNMFQPLPGISLSLHHILSNTDWCFPSLFEVRDWNDLEVCRQFLRNFADRYGFDPLMAENWRSKDGLLRAHGVIKNIRSKNGFDNFSSFNSRGSNCWRNMEGVCDSCSIMPLLIIFRYRKASIHSITVSHLSLITGFSLLEQKETLAVLIVSRRQGKAAGVPGAEGGVIPNTPVNFCFRRTIG